jgi:tetratricopeptide (TPR) repeat protein
VVNDEENMFDDNIKDITLSKNYDSSIDEIMKKIFRNLIVVLLKLNEKDECLKYCNKFLRLYLNDEKVYYFLFVINKERGNFNICKTILEKMIKLYDKNNDKLKEYTTELENINNILIKHKNDHDNYMKKMMKKISE